MKDINHKRVYRLCKEMKLSLAFKKSKRLTHQDTKRLTSSQFINEHWIIDFISDRLTKGRIYRYKIVKYYQNDVDILLQLQRAGRIYLVKE